MGNYDDQMELPPGFRFHPTDEELITHYLNPKVLDNCFSARAVSEVDLNKCEPWDLPWRAEMGEKERYFFCVRDRKYPTGLRTNRATVAGYWKATGKDKEIYKAKSLVGMKKTLVFYKGRAPKGEKSNWVMHEYRLDGRYSAYNLPKTAKNEWVICRVFQKSCGGKKTHIQGIVKIGSFENDMSPSVLPPLMDSSPYNSKTITAVNETSHVTCFSNPMVEDHTTTRRQEEEEEEEEDDMIDNFNTSVLASSSSSNPHSFYANQILPNLGNLQHCSDAFLFQDQSILKILLENHHETNMRPNPNPKTEFSQDSMVSNQEDPSTSGGPVDLHCLWNY